MVLDLFFLLRDSENDRYKTVPAKGTSFIRRSILASCTISKTSFQAATNINIAEYST